MRGVEWGIENTIAFIGIGIILLLLVFVLFGQIVGETGIMDIFGW
jgi:hypothetical protein